MLYIKSHRWIIAKGAAILSSFALLSPLASAETTCLGERTPAQREIAAADRFFRADRSLDA